MKNLLTFYPKVSLGGDVYEVVGMASPATTLTTLIPPHSACVCSAFFLFYHPNFYVKD